MSLLLLVVALVGLWFFLRKKKKAKSVSTNEAAFSPGVEAWISEVLSADLRKLTGLGTEAAKKKLVATLGGDPDPDVVSIVAEAVRKVDLELTRYPHEADAELAVVVRYEDGRETRTAKRIPASELPKDVAHELSTRAVTRVFREWRFSWDR
jgi:hypothetical protein